MEMYYFVNAATIRSFILFYHTIYNAHPLSGQPVVTCNTIANVEFYMI